MYIETFRLVVNQLKTSLTYRENYLKDLSKIDNNLSTNLVENKYIDSVLLENDFLIQNFFGDLAEHVYWFLYDWKPGFQVVYNEVTYTIDTFEDYITCTQQMYNLPIMPKTRSEDIKNE